MMCLSKKILSGILAAAIVFTMGVPEATAKAETKGKLTGYAASDAISIPDTSSNTNNIGAKMPYTRYDSETASLGGGARMVSSNNWDLTNIASQASNQSYVELPSNGSYAEWTVNTSGNGVVMRFTLPDTYDGIGQNGNLDIYINNQRAKTIDLTSYFMWQYLDGGANDIKGSGTACFAFDEVHFRLDNSLKAGDKIRIQSTKKNNLTYGVDFLEIEETGATIPQPAGSYSVVDYGAVPNDGVDDYIAIMACIADANTDRKDVYLPAGTYHINQIWSIKAKDMMITGAGMWYTNIQFTNSAQQGGGISGAGNGETSNIEFCNMYINSNLRSRYGENAIYKCFMDVFAGKSLIHDVWEEHFECGVWLADYGAPVDYSDYVKIVNCRLRNNLADGINFCQGTSNATVYNCSIRNNGDDGLAIWNNNYLSAKDESNNIFCYNTIDFVWRAGAIAVYGGNGHKIYNNYIRDCFMASGIHLNTTFPGYQFNNTKNMQFDNNIIVHGGCSYDTWKSEFGAVDITGDTKNVTFNNTYIYDAQHDGVRVGDKLSNIVFNNLYIYGTGVDKQTPSYSSVPHAGAAIMAFRGDPPLTVNGLHLSNIAYKDIFYNTVNLRVNGVSYDNNYSISAYPTPGNINTNHRNHATAESTNAMPDLVVTDIGWEPINPAVGDEIIFKAVIKNQGTGVAPQGMVNGGQFQIDGKCVSWSDINTTQIQPGQSVTITANYGPNKIAFWKAESGTHTVTAWINDTVRFNESNMNNNQYTKNIYVNNKIPQGLPDLVVTDISWEPQHPVVGDELIFKAVIKNQGTGVAPQGMVNGAQFQIDGKCVSWSDTNTTQIQPGQSVTITANYGPNKIAIWKAESGTHTVTAWINDTARFEESNKDNNRYTKQISIAN